MTPEQIARFWAKVDTSGGPDACWPWMGYRNPKGYGVVSVNKHNVGTHRIAWIVTHGAITEGMDICHSCDDPPCCNPAHLWEGTQADNTADRHAKGRDHRGDAHYRAKLTAEIVATMRSRYATGTVTTVALAQEFGVSPRTVWSAVRGESWAHLESVPPVPAKEFSDADIMRSRERWARGTTDLRSLMREFNVSRETVYAIIYGRIRPDLPVLSTPTRGIQQHIAGDTVRALRRQQGLSQSQLVAQIGFGAAVPWISRIENGKHPVVSGRMLNAIARALNVSRDVLLAPAAAPAEAA